MISRVTRIPIALLVVSCAISEPPPGGPEDTTAPEITETFPLDRSPQVDATTRIEIGFSEKMKRANVDRLVVFSPSVGVVKTRWKKNTMILEPEQPLHPDTTYVVRIEPGFADAHGVRAEKSYHFAFATSAYLDTGMVSGRVLFRREPTGKALVRLFVLPKDTSFTVESALADRQASTAEDGTYELEYLPVTGVKFLIWTFQDNDGNGFFDPEKESGATFPDTVSLSSSIPILTLPEIFIIDPKEPCVVTGQIVNETGNDSMPVTVTLHAVSDTLPPTYLVRSDLEGKYKFDNVLRGTYTLHAFLDLVADSLCGSYPCPDDSTRSCLEPCVTHPDTLVLDPGDEVHLERLSLSVGPVEE